MKSVHLIKFAADAPQMEFVGDVPANLLAFDGKTKRGTTWPQEPPEVQVSFLSENPFVFYSLTPGALVVREDALKQCDDFYWVTRDGCESLPLKCGDVWFEIINVVDFLPLPEGAGENPPPCLIDRYYSALFRIPERPTKELFCVTGVGVPMNEFKPVYERFGFSGLEFIEIWRGEG